VMLAINGTLIAKVRIERDTSGFSLCLCYRADG